MIEVDDEEKVINAVYLMTIRAPSVSHHMNYVGKRYIAALHSFHDLLGTFGSIGLMIFLIR